MYRELYAFSEDFKERYLVLKSSDMRKPWRFIVDEEIDKKEYPLFCLITKKSKANKAPGLMSIGDTESTFVKAQWNIQGISIKQALNMLEDQFTNQSNQLNIKLSKLIEGMNNV